MPTYVRVVSDLGKRVPVVIFAKQSCCKRKLHAFSRGSYIVDHPKLGYLGPARAIRCPPTHPPRRSIRGAIETEFEMQDAIRPRKRRPNGKGAAFPQARVPQTLVTFDLVSLT